MLDGVASDQANKKKCRKQSDEPIFSPGLCKSWFMCRHIFFSHVYLSGCPTRWRTTIFLYISLGPHEQQAGHRRSACITQTTTGVYVFVQVLSVLVFVSPLHIWGMSVWMHKDMCMDGWPQAWRPVCTFLAARAYLCTTNRRGTLLTKPRYTCMVYIHIYDQATASVRNKRTLSEPMGARRAARHREHINSSK